MDTISKGRAAEAAVLAALMEAGFPVLVPFSGAAPYDLVVDCNDRLLKVQVKAGRVRGDVIICNTCSTDHGRGRRTYQGLADLLDTAETNAADALHRVHRALELDGQADDYTADEWLPVIYDAAAPLLESSQLDRDPPSVVLQTQEAVRWLSSSIACADGDSRETPAALTDTLARLLVVCVFADVARRYESPEE